LIGIYNFVNLLFIYKYSVMVTSHHLATCLVYAVIVNLLFVILFIRNKKEPYRQYPGGFYLLMTGVITIVLFIFMTQLAPSQIEVARSPALYQWIERFLQGEFPYKAETRPSALPFLFILSIPFYLLGEVGLLQIAAFLFFSLLVLTNPLKRSIRGGACILFLSISPVFLYELVVRSDLFSNMILLLLFGVLLEKVTEKELKPPSILLLGAAGGFLLATRMIVIPVYIFVLIPYLRNRRENFTWFIAGSLLSFAVITLPFWFWDNIYFLDRGPFAIQSSYISTWTIVPIMLLTILEGLKVKSLVQACSSSALVLFAAVFLPFLHCLLLEGWQGAIFDDRFDISYFAFCLPFLIISLNFYTKDMVSGLDN
jgi:hypothetical protein